MVALRSPRTCIASAKQVGEGGHNPPTDKRCRTMRYVYLLQSISHVNERYVGISSDFQERLKQHNSSSSPHTKKHQPWNPVVVVRFEDDAKAEAFERYLKSGSGHAFAKRHFW